MSRMQDALAARAGGNIVDVSKVLALSPADVGRSGGSVAPQPGPAPKISLG